MYQKALNIYLVGIEYSKEKKKKEKENANRIYTINYGRGPAATVTQGQHQENKRTARIATM